MRLGAISSILLNRRSLFGHSVIVFLILKYELALVLILFLLLATWFSICGNHCFFICPSHSRYSSFRSLNKSISPYFINSDFQRAINGGLFRPYWNAICRYNSLLVKYDSTTASLNSEIYLVLSHFRHKPSLPNSLNTLIQSRTWLASFAPYFLAKDLYPPSLFRYAVTTFNLNVRLYFALEFII